jgi:hypothetical protein
LVRGAIGLAIVGVIVLIVIITIVVFLNDLHAPVIVGLIVLAIIVGVGLWIWKNKVNHLVIPTL